jgi:predicted transcriptional regulator
MAARDEAIKSLQEMSDTATWDDIMYTIYVRARISEGLKEVEEGNLIPHEEIKKRFSE